MPVVIDADSDLLGGLPARVGHGVVCDHRARVGHEADVAVVGIADGSRPPPLAIGEAKWNDTMGVDHVERLRHIRDLVGAVGRYDTSNIRPGLFSSAGFNGNARAAAEASGDVLVVDLPMPYGHQEAMPKTG